MSSAKPMWRRRTLYGIAHHKEAESFPLQAKTNDTIRLKRLGNRFSLMGILTQRSQRFRKDRKGLGRIFDLSIYD